MKTLTINEAIDYLKQNPFEKLKVLYNGKNRRIFYNQERKQFGMYYPGATRYGHFFMWDSLTAIFAPKDEAEEYRKMTAKFIKYARRASFTNPFIRKCLAADPAKSPYQNGLTVGCQKDGEIISLTSIANTDPYVATAFRTALKNREKYHSYFFKFRGYDATLSVQPHKEGNYYSQPGDIMGYLSLEYTGTGNGHYYSLINDENFIYVEQD